MADRTQDNTRGIVWSIVGIIVVLLVAWMVWAAVSGNNPTPGVPNTGTNNSTTNNAAQSTPADTSANPAY